MLRFVYGLLALVASTAIGGQAWGQLVTYGINGLTGTTTSVSATTGSNVTATSLTRGTGLTAASASNGFNSQSWGGTSAATSFSGSDFVTFTLAPDANYTLSFTSLTSAAQRSGSGPVNAGWYYSINSFGTALTSTTALSSSTDTNLNATLTNTSVTSATEFRFAAFESPAVAGTATARISATAASRNLQIAGSATLRSAGTLTWDGGRGNGDWNSYLGTNANQSNWNQNNLPTTSLVDALQFAGSTQTTTNNNIANLTVGSITFNSGASAFTNSGNSLTLNADVTNSSSSNQTISHNIALSSGSHTVSTGGSGNTILGGVISTASGTSPITFSGAGSGRVDITNTANTFTGTINLNSTEVRFSGADSFGNANNTIVIDGGRMATASSTTYELASTHAIQVGDTAGTSISVVSSGTLTYNGVIADVTGKTGAWAKQGVGTLALGGVSTYSGATSINNGILRLTTGNDRLPTGTVVNLGQAGSNNTGTFDLNGRNQQIAGLVSVTGTGTGTNNVINSSTASTLTIGGSGTYSYGSSSAANSGTISGDITVTKTGSGTQTLGQSNTYNGGTNINGGILSFVNGALGTSGSITVNGGTLQWNGTNTQDISSRLVLQNSGSATFDTNSNNVTLANAFGGSTTSSFTKIGAGTLTLSGANTYTGTTTINAGTLALSSTGSIGTSSSITVNTGATYDVSAVSGYALAGTQTLTGTGTVNGSVTVGALRTVQGGTAANPFGTTANLVFNNDLTVATDGKLGIRIGIAGDAFISTLGNSSDAGANNSKIAVSAVLDVTDGSFTIDGSGAIFTHGSTYSYLIASGGTVNAVDITDSGRFTFTNINTGALESFRLQNDVGGNVYLNFTAVPEPGLIFGLSAGLLALAGVVRKRLKSKTLQI